MDCTLRAGILKALLDSTRELCTSANFQFDGDGLRMQAMDTAHVSLISLALAPCAFLSYLCSEKPSTLGIHFEALSVVLKTCAADDQIKLAWEQGGDHLTIARKDRQFDLKLLEVDKEITSVPELCYEVSATVPASEFQKICRDLKDIGGDTISVCAAPDGITCKVDGDLGSGTAVMKEGVSIDSCVAVTSSYSLRYLAAFTKCVTLCSNVLIQMGKETPLRLTYVVDAASPEHGRLEFFLAPRVSD